MMEGAQASSLWLPLLCLQRRILLMSGADNNKKNKLLSLLRQGSAVQSKRPGSGILSDHAGLLLRRSNLIRPRIRDCDRQRWIRLNGDVVDSHSLSRV